MNNLAKRSVTGISFVIAMIGSALLGQLFFAALFLVVTILGLMEFYGLAEKTGANPPKYLSVTAGVLLFGTLALNAAGKVSSSLLLVNILLFFLLFLAELWRKKDKPFENIAWSLMGIFYIALPLGLAIYFFNPAIPSGLLHFGTLIGYLAILWLNDTGAYFVGSMLGKHRLFERISPKKSWEGSIGGAIFALLTSYAASCIFIQHTTWQWLVMALLIIVFGTLGDLVESMFKRSLGIKDSGSILPGHGGILDRFDAVFVSVPFVFVFLTLIS